MKNPLKANMVTKPAPTAKSAAKAKHQSTDSGVFLLSPESKRSSVRNSANTLNLDLEKNTIVEDEQLPPKRKIRVLRHARHTFLNVYRRLFSLVFVFNIAGLGGLLARNHRWTTDPPLSAFATAAAANILVALLIRQDYIVNLCYKATWIVPLWAPLRVRRMLAKVYEYGGVHSGAAVSSVLWFILLTSFLTNEFAAGHVAPDPAAIGAFSYALLLLLLALCITAYPKFRFGSHNTFEQVHRWAGWFSLALFWVEIVLFARTQVTNESGNLGMVCIQMPAFWFLLVASLHTINPWIRLHKMPVEAEKLSDHAVRLHFKEPVPLFVGLRISEAPLGEWHSFACIPARDGGKSGGSVIISDAGDWTKETIRNPQPYYYVKGIPVTGVLCVAQIFKRVVIVTTGSGIGPCLGVMQDIPQTSCRVIWSTPSPEKTYRKGICDAVKAVDPDALVWDTRQKGRPDLVQLAYQMYKESNAEAVFVISNPKLTKKVVYGMESRGIPGFGPIWDS
ncbi:Adenylate-forming reductase [Lachnellula suecica]|uniref:Adenylate-forming reductase n=1 Tax=Lachnellula suecica TaxID=602035 RepID=A0A8T9C8Q9_9HELO|nr:Adenylate-forming reductase [Lachnellula suecica]